MNVTYEAEMTDTFGGEANYSWVRRAEFQAPSDASSRLLLRRARAALSAPYSFRTTGDYGDMVRADARWACICMFITVKE